MATTAARGRRTRTGAPRGLEQTVRLAAQEFADVLDGRDAVDDRDGITAPCAAENGASASCTSTTAGSGNGAIGTAITVTSPSRTDRTPPSPAATGTGQPRQQRTRQH
ncbi:hypothetical protein GCM10022222_39640 [Amycolatopsis ultiminotia]|uniref:Uncharacterized protein n=1 Tax=Amycolatopsis ultiminotia TaxID=543629 RepID=A0ABP6WKR3_9PSEU